MLSVGLSSVGGFSIIKRVEYLLCFRLWLVLPLLTRGVVKSVGNVRPLLIPVGHHKSFANGYSGDAIDLG